MMEEKKEITLKEMLVLMDVRAHPDGRPMVHSFKFVMKDGRLRFFPQALVCGAGRMDNKAYRVRGLQPCDCKGWPEDHVHPVRIHNIIEFDGRRVVYTLKRIEDGDSV